MLALPLVGAGAALRSTRPRVVSISDRIGMWRSCGPSLNHSPLGSVTITVPDTSPMLMVRPKLGGGRTGFATPVGTSATLVPSTTTHAIPATTLRPLMADNRTSVCGAIGARSGSLGELRRPRGHGLEVSARVGLRDRDRAAGRGGVDSITGRVPLRGGATGATSAHLFGPGLRRSDALATVPEGGLSPVDRGHPRHASPKHQPRALCGPDERSPPSVYPQTL